MKTISDKIVGHSLAYRSV